MTVEVVDAPVAVAPPAVATPPAVAATPPAAATPAAAPVPSDPPAAAIGAPAPVPIAERIDPKFRVEKDGAFDLEASATKQAEAYAQLSKKLGTADARPAAATEYKLELPEKFKALEATLDPETVKGFQAKAFDAGLSQSQYAWVMAQWAEAAPTMVQGAKALDFQTAKADLEKSWGPENFAANVAAGQRTIRAFAGEEAEAILQSVNDPRIWRLLAKVGAEIGEDRIPRIESHPVSGEGELAELKASDAYKDARHPQHAAVSARVMDYFKRQTGGK